MPADQDPPYLGGWAADELGPTLQQSSGAGADSDIIPSIRFMCGVARLVRKRLAIDSEQTDPKELSVFLLSPDAGGQPNLAHEPMLDAGKTPIAGKVWFVNAPVVAGRAKNLDVQDSDGVFRTVTEELQLGDLHAVIVDPRGNQTEVRYYPKGLNEEEIYELVSLDQSNIDLEKICNVIEGVYRQCLVTPDAQSLGNKLWSDPEKFWPHSNAEHKIQAYLKPAFVAAFPTCVTSEEFAGTMGRADLHIQEPNPLDRSKVTYIAVLELNVLRSFSDGGTPYSESKVTNWVEEGVNQAWAYQEERGHRVAALCCFDMRKADNGLKCFEDVGERADKLKIGLRRWYLYASSKQARKAGAAIADSAE